MDVVTPPPAEHEKPQDDHEIDPLDKLAAEDQADQAAAKKTETKPEAKPPKPKHIASSSGVGLAITATIIIVLGLAVLATYAYLQTAK